MMSIPRLRIFAGPNGSGKSTIIKAVRGHRTAAERPLSIGQYINADEIAQLLKAKHGLRLGAYGLPATKIEWHAFVRTSGLLADGFDFDSFLGCHDLRRGRLILSPTIGQGPIERLAQIVAAYSVDQALAEGKNFSFETVFSHTSKLDLMHRASKAGYKVYLYFVSTESPLINEDRVMIRVREGGHDVPKDRIRSRYYRSLGLLHPAAQVAYHAYFFDNSGTQSNMFAECKLASGGKRDWHIDWPRTPHWFFEHLVRKHLELPIRSAEPTT